MPPLICSKCQHGCYNHQMKHRDSWCQHEWNITHPEMNRILVTFRNQPATKSSSKERTRRAFLKSRNSFSGTNVPEKLPKTFFGVTQSTGVSQVPAHKKVTSFSRDTLRELTWFRYLTIFPLLSLKTFSKRSPNRSSCVSFNKNLFKILYNEMGKQKTIFQFFHLISLVSCPRHLAIFAKFSLRHFFF